MLYEDNYLAHYGVKGQKWGVRRYQNEDGTLTQEGKDRFKALRSYEGRGAQNVTEPGVDRERRLMKKIAKAESKGKDKRAAKLESKLIAQQKANDDAKEYAKENSYKINRSERWGEASATATGDTAGTRAALRAYHKAKARGAGSARAFVEAFIPGGTLLRAIGNKKKYGKAIIYDDMNRDESITT